MMMNRVSNIVEVVTDMHSRDSQLLFFYCSNYFPLNHSNVDYFSFSFTYWDVKFYRHPDNLCQLARFIRQANLS